MPKPRPAHQALLCAATASAGVSIVPGAGATSATSRSAAAHTARGCGPTSLRPRRNNVQIIAAITICLINRQRAAHGVRPLHVNGALMRAARGHSIDMVSHGYFSHDTPQGVSPFARMLHAGYAAKRRACAMGENIAAATGPFSTPASIVRMWMNSPGHRANILSSTYRDTGLGVAYGYPGARRARGATYTQDFGRHC
jgi:uncharacterized protein YkwD